MASKRQKRGGPDSQSPIDAKKRALAEQEAKVQAEIARRRKLIEDAPKIARERERMRQEQLVKSRSRTDGRGASRAALPDLRVPLQATVQGRRRLLLSERRQGRMMFFVLLAAFGALVWYLYHLIHP
jgi:hypothetical protein